MVMSLRSHWNWVRNANQTQVAIWKKRKDQATFPPAPAAQLGEDVDTWTDTRVEVGQAFEYKGSRRCDRTRRQGHHNR